MHGRMTLDRRYVFVYPHDHPARGGQAFGGNIEEMGEVTKVLRASYERMVERERERRDERSSAWDLVRAVRRATREPTTENKRKVVLAINGALGTKERLTLLEGLGAAIPDDPELGGDVHVSPAEMPEAQGYQTRP